MYLQLAIVLEATKSLNGYDLRPTLASVYTR